MNTNTCTFSHSTLYWSRVLILKLKYNRTQSNALHHKDHHVHLLHGKNLTQMILI